MAKQYFTITYTHKHYWPSVKYVSLVSAKDLDSAQHKLERKYGEINVLEHKVEDPALIKRYLESGAGKCLS